MNDQGSTRGGGCACGAVRYHFTGDPVLEYKCHCLDCQLASGGGGVAVTWVPSDGFALARGEPRYREIVADSGRKIARGFCPECGTPVLVRVSVPGIVGIFATSLDEPERFRPEYEIWTSRTRAWDGLSEDVLHFEKNFPAEVVRRRLKR